MNVQLTTEWLKVPGGEVGGSWAVRISGKPIRDGVYLLLSETMLALMVPHR